MTRNKWTHEVVTDHLCWLLEQSQGSVAQAARDGKIPERSFWAWVKRSPQLGALERRLKAERREEQSRSAILPP